MITQEHIETVIGDYCFGHLIHEAFMKASKDRNPIHADKYTAERCLTGKLIVHGIHSLLAAMECWLAIHEETPSHIKCDFMSPIHVGDTAVFKQSCINPGQWKIKIMVDKTCCATLSITASNSAPQPIDDTRKIATIFPRMSARTSAETVTALLSCSHHVGMIFPGLYSLFSSLDVHIDYCCSGTDITITTDTYDERFGLYTLSVSGVLYGTIKAFQRPEPVVTPALTQIRTMVHANEFCQLNALIIGGSRGIGACTAKVLAAGGANTCLTYRNSEHEAAVIQDEINAYSPGSSQIRSLDVITGDISSTLAETSNINAVFYFATPQISKNTDIDQAKLFRSIYLDGLKRLCDQLENTYTHTITVFMPSTIFIEQPVRHFSTYTDTKLAAEKLAEHINQQYQHVRIKTYRLPIMRTDQTITSSSRHLPEVLDTILPFLRDFYEALLKNQGLASTLT